MSLLITIGELLRAAADWLVFNADSIRLFVMLLGLGLVVIGPLLDKLNVSPFGRFYQAARRPADQWFADIRNSQFYYPLKRAFFKANLPDAVWFILALAFLLVFVFFPSWVSYVASLLSYSGLTLIQFGEGRLLRGAWSLLGTVLVALLYYLMALMTILVFNSWFGFFKHYAYLAGRRINPLLYRFDPSGRYAMIVFLLAFLVLQFAAGFVASIFFRSAAF